jgi:hypothetical protein
MWTTRRIAMKTAQQIADKWGRVTPTRQQDYVDGITSPRADWATQTLAAESAYKAGLSASLAKGTWAGGVRRVGTAKWKFGATEKGPGRWAEGVSKGTSAYAAGFRPYADALAGIKLPPRSEKGSPANLLRVASVANLLHATKVSLGGGR